MNLFFFLPSLLLAGFLGCTPLPPPDQGDSIILDQLDDRGACGDLLAYAQASDHTGRLVAWFDIEPVATAVQENKSLSWVIPLEQSAWAEVFLEVGEHLPDPCENGGNAPVDDSRLYYPVKGSLRVSATPLESSDEEGHTARIDVAVDRAIFLGDSGVISIEQLIIDDAYAP